MNRIIIKVLKRNFIGIDKIYTMVFVIVRKNVMEKEKEMEMETVKKLQYLRFKVEVL